MKTKIQLIPYFPKELDLYSHFTEIKINRLPSQEYIDYFYFDSDEDSDEENYKQSIHNKNIQ